MIVHNYRSESFEVKPNLNIRLIVHNDTVAYVKLPHNGEDGRRGGGDPRRSTSTGL